MSCSSPPVTATSRSMPGKGGGGRADRLRDGERVVEQSVPVGLVVELRRRRLAEAPPAGGALAEEAVEQGGEVRVLDRRDQGAQVAFEALDGGVGDVEQVGAVVFALGGGADPLQGHARAVALVHRVAALGDHDRPRGAEVEDLVDTLPELGGDAAGAIGENQLQPVAAVLLPPALAAADDEGGRHLLAVGEVADEDPGGAAVLCPICRGIPVDRDGAVDAELGVHLIVVKVESAPDG